MDGPGSISSPISTRRILCALLPHVATDRIRASCPDPTDTGRPTSPHTGCPTPLCGVHAAPGWETLDNHANPPPPAAPHTPLALTRQTAASIFITQVCPLAAARGVHTGMTLGQAYALAPDLRAFEDDPAATRELLRSLAAWTLRFSPLVQAWDDALLLDVTGAARLFRGETALARRVLGGLSQKGLHVRVAIADTVGAAYALATAGGQAICIAPPRTASARLAPLPLRTLRIDPPAAAQLDQVGVRTVGELLRLPRGDLPARFGREIVLRLQQALGEVYEPITPEPAEQRPHAREEFDPPLREPQLVQSAAQRLLEGLAAEVARRGRALRRLECVLHLERREPVEFSIALARATRELRHIRELLRRRMEKAWLEQTVQNRVPHPVVQNRVSHPVVQNRVPHPAVRRSRRTGVGDTLAPGDARDRTPHPAFQNRVPHPVVQNRVSHPVVQNRVPHPAVRRSRRTGVGDTLAPGAPLDPQDATRHAPPTPRTTDTSFDHSVTALLLIAQETEPWTGRQATLFDVEDPAGARDLAEMLDRIGARLGPHAVVRARPVDDHQPERAFEYVSVSDWPLSDALPAAQPARVARPPPAGPPAARKRAKPSAADDESALQAEQHVPRPLRLLRPIEIREAPGTPRMNRAAHPPMRFTCGGRVHTVSRFWGPQRVETGWWRGPDVRRDYYRVETTTGEQLWLFRALDEGHWFLHGVYG